MRTILLIMLLALCIAASGQIVPDSSSLKTKAPDKFKATFETTKGSFTVEFIREWSPLGVDRVYQLLTTGFYTNNSLFRVQKEYVVQFGICDNRSVNSFWDKHPIADEPVKAQNLKGTVSYARDGPRTRTAQLFINKKDNPKLDTVNYNGLRGFPPIGTVVSGFDVVDSFYPEYGFEPANHQDSVMVQGNAYLKNLFPNLDFITKGSIVKE